MKKGFTLFFMKSISLRKGRIAIASISVTLAIAIITGMIGITAGIQEKLGSELKAYGANIMVSPAEGTYLEYGMKERIAGITDVESVSGQILDRATLNRDTIEIIGLDTGSLREMGWKLEGSWPEKQGEILAGVNLRDALKLKAGDRITLGAGGGNSGFVVKGFIERGGAEDSAFIMSLSDAWNLSELDGKLSVILLNGRSGKLDELVNTISKAFPGVTVKTVRQVARAEESILSKIQLLMILVTVVVLITTMISVGSTMGANIIERREEIGLMKAIGAARGEIRSFYIAEAVLIGLLGGCAGFIAGSAAALAVSKGAFGSYITIPFYVPMVSLTAGVAIAAVSSYFPVRDALSYSPADILRGE